jgi:phosphoenolpyruvate carboxylase
VKRTDIQFPAKHTALRDDVHALGELMGQILLDQGGRILFERVERDRLLAIRRRSGDAAAAAELAAAARGLDPATARDLTRAFSMWFLGVNLAEKVHRIRRRRAYFLRDATRPQPGGIEDAIAQLKAQGLAFEQVLDLIAQLRIEPVFTAHPTESARRTLLRMQQRVAGLMLDRLDPTLSPNEQRDLIDRIRVELTTAWQTEDHPRERLTVADEREHVVFYLAEVLYEVVPAFYEEIAASLARLYDVGEESIVLPTILRFGTWVGGDMDGNPDVHAKAIRETLARQQQVIVNAYFTECQSLAQSLSQSASRIGVSPELQQRIEQYATLIPGARASTPARHDRMPYRVFLGQIAERLRLTYEGRPNGYENPAQLRRDVQLIAESLRLNRGRYAGRVPVLRLLRRIDTFGFHLATLDVRQHSDVHHQVLAEALDDPEWTRHPPEERHALLTEAIERDRGPRGDLDALARRTLGVFEAMVQCRHRYGPHAIGHYVVSGVSAADDVLAPLLLARWAEAYDRRSGEVAIDIAPLFESVATLEHSGAIMQALLNDPLYRRHLDARGREQCIVVGYSESSKESGLCASRFAAWRAQAALADVLHKGQEHHVIFHARGGSVARGGGRIDTVVRTMPPSAVNGVLRLTEQGEVINQNYGLGPIAMRTLERSFGALALATAAVGRAVDVRSEYARYASIAATVAEASRERYRALVWDDPMFFDYFQAVTPIDVIERMQIGSRPAMREGRRGLDALRAVAWVFAWTQTRTLLPGWFGAGSGLRAAILAHGLPTVSIACRDWPFLRNLLDDVEAMLARADLDIAAYYNELAPPELRGRFEPIREEYRRAVEAIFVIKQYDELLEGDRTLQRAIQLRNPYVDPMNLVQVDLLRRWRAGGRADRALFDALLASISGISQGLQSTG